jgi:uncharacterized membrane protein
MMNETFSTQGLTFLLKLVLLLAVINTAYLSWRYLALHEGLVTAGTGICSLTDFVDCDKVLSTNEARAFYVPNAILGFGFFFGSFLWLMIGLRLDEKYHYHLIRTLVFWLVVATFFTFRFIWLLVQLPALCPLCPWNHLLTYLATIFAFLLWRKTPHNKAKAEPKPLILLVSLCVGQFFLWLVLWFILSGK